MSAVGITSVARPLIPSITTALRGIFTGSGSGVLKTGIKVGAGAGAVAVGGLAVNESLKSITSPVEKIFGIEQGGISGLLIIGIIAVILFMVVSRK